MNIIEIIDSYASLEDRIAVTYRDFQLSYRQLFDQSNALATYLIEQFGHDQTPIIVFGHKQVQMLVCFIACVKAGHAYIPVDSSLPMERMQDIISNSGSNLVFAMESLQTLDTQAQIISISMMHEILDQYQGRFPDPAYRVKEEDTYYIIYTSGSTGNPKGVQITRSCLESFIRWGREIIGTNKVSAVFLNQAPFSFDLSVMDLYLSLDSGSTLFSIDKKMISNLAELFNTLKDSKITYWVSTPSFAEMCLADRKFSQELLPGLTKFLFCGETLANQCAKSLYERFPHATVVNLYGPTEATVAVTEVTITDTMINANEPLPVGFVKGDCQIHILDDGGSVLSDGEKGEICIVGDSVSPGYYKNSEFTKAKFSIVEIEWIKKRAYKTGDQGYLKNGLLYYCGRMDSQIKLNGYRIELEDIENNLRKLEWVENAVVVPKIQDGKVKYLVAFVVLKKMGEKDLAEDDFETGLLIKQALKRYVPEYMVPRQVQSIDALPMNVNGKANRKLLLESIL